MVCSKCQKKLEKTELATPAVKKKNDMFYGSTMSTMGGGGGGESKKSSATLGNTGVSKVGIPYMCFFTAIIVLTYYPI